MVWIGATAATPRSQWESSSGSFDYSQRFNCGPTCATFIAGYYHDGKPSIEHTRTLAGIPRGVPTTYQQQANMLGKRGIPAVLVDVLSLDHLERLVMDGRRPVILALEMGRVPYVTRGYSFSGWHSVVAVKRTTRNGVRGWVLRDPNFQLKSNVRRFYSDAVLKYAFIDNWQSWAIVPHEPKKLRVEFRDGVTGVNLYDEPGSRKVYADVKAHGIYRHSDGKRLAAHGHNFEFVRYSPTKEYMVLRSFGHTLYAKSKNLHFVKVPQ